MKAFAFPMQDLFCQPGDSQKMNVESVLTGVEGFRLKWCLQGKAAADGEGAYWAALPDAYAHRRLGRGQPDRQVACWQAQCSVLLHPHEHTAPLNDGPVACCGRLIRCWNA